MTEHRWWYLLLSSQVTLKILDTGTGKTETYFRDRLDGYREQPGKYGWPDNIHIGPNSSWVLIANEEIGGRLESGNRFSFAEETNSRLGRFQGRRFNVVVRGGDSAAAKLTLTSVQMKTGKIVRTELPPLAFEFSWPRGDRPLLSERVRKGDQSLRRLFTLDDEGILCRIEAWRDEREGGVIVWPSSGTPRREFPRPIEGLSYRSSGLYSCAEVGGRCLTVEGVGNNPTPDRFPAIHQLDLETGADKPIAAFAGSIQWLEDSVVFAQVDQVVDSGFPRVRQQIVRYFPRDARREILFSAPNHGPIK